MQFSVTVIFCAANRFFDFCIFSYKFQRFIHWYLLHLHRAGDELLINNWDLHTDLLSSFSLSWF